MSQFRVLPHAALIGLLLLVLACTPAPTPAGIGDVASAPTPTGEPPATAAESPTNAAPTLTDAQTVAATTAPPKTTVAVTATATSLPPTPTETPPAPTGTPGIEPPVAGQGNADVLHVRAVQTADSGTGSGRGSTWTFHVTVEHPDTGWEDYADGWDVVTPDGAVLKPDPSSPFTRLLLHPHENEQPFTRSQSGIVIPEGVTQVRVRAHDLVDGFGGREVLVDLMATAGEGFEVERSP